MCDFEVNQPFVHYEVMIMYKVGLRGETSFNIWYMAIIKWWIFHTVLLKIPAVMLLVFFPSIHTPEDHLQFIYIRRRAVQYPTTNHKMKLIKIHPGKLTWYLKITQLKNLPTIIFRFHVRCTHHNAQHPMTQYPSNTIPMDNFLITITNGWKFFLKDHWRWN